ncbi:hypothetical protein [Lentilactobacillus farraginis]|uniref:hypothetical protein n=1 Tax=Lentilactobacillus farraginis TaxID=390841 RepID=UPI001ED9B544|nr:hypothetical protein [Lentilactobacillus farraginis]
MHHKKLIGLAAGLLLVVGALAAVIPINRVREATTTVLLPRFPNHPRPICKIQVVTRRLQAQINHSPAVNQLEVTPTALLPASQQPAPESAP